MHRMVTPSSLAAITLSSSIVGAIESHAISGGPLSAMSFIAVSSSLLCNDIFQHYV